jgi:serine/threonine protein kinase
LTSLLAALLAKNPRQRITTEAALNHPWLATFDKKQFSVGEFADLDDAVAAEMRTLGYDTIGIIQELAKGVVNPRTAAYKMLKRKKTVAEMKPERIAPSKMPPPIFGRRGSCSIKDRERMIHVPTVKPAIKIRQGSCSRLLLPTRQLLK